MSSSISNVQMAHDMFRYTYNCVLCIYVCMYVCMYIRMYVCVCVHIRVCMCVFVFIKYIPILSHRNLYMRLVNTPGNYHCAWEIM